MDSKNNKIRLVVLGARGRMGSRIIALAQECDQFHVVAGVEMGDQLEAFLPQADVVIDFTAPDQVVKTAQLVSKYKKGLVVGTTGVKPGDVARLKQCGKKIPIVFSPNMSVGVNLLFQLVKLAASKIPHYDIEIVEAHHNQKKDAPSGTAMKLADIAAEASDRSNKNFIFGRNGLIGPRKKKEIGVMSLRAGDIVGDHTVLLSNTGERLELTHRAHSRDTFATGALTAAAWLVQRKAGFYSMADVLGFSNSY